ncbi:hypothetical protein HYV84_01820 [Candidatus Woesearchaeota archaeon]|nr:hypothetical protein [Candidatus Woesearchaeota archaeon]
MGKQKIIDELTTLLAKALRHHIGSMVNEIELYARQYAKDADVLFREARKVSLQINWNAEDKRAIYSLLKKKMHDELAKKEFIGEKKFEIMDEEMDRSLKEMGIA